MFCRLCSARADVTRKKKARTMAGRAELDQAHLRANVAIAALASPARVVARRLGRKPDYVRYWKRKLTDPAFHAQPCGGDYNRKFDAASQLAFEVNSLFSISELESSSDRSAAL
jgi:hypothetical protein